MDTPARAFGNWVLRYNPLLAALFFMTFCAVSDAGAASSQDGISIPLKVVRVPRYDTYKAIVSIGFGNLRRLPVAFDTGSAGLHVFGAAKLDAPDSGVQCTQTTVDFTVGNPGRVTYHGVICYAVLKFENFTTPAPVPIAYLTSAMCTSTNPHCKLPDLNNPKAHGGVYGVFGAGITGPMPVQNPLLALSVSTYSIELTRAGGELRLGAPENPDAVPFPLAPGARAGAKWQNGQACLFVNGEATRTCMAISFDTGNGVPWIHDADATSIPQKDGLVTPQTRIGFAPPGATHAATSVVAGKSFANRIKIVPANRTPLTNTSIEAFFGHVMTYDNLNGRISVAPR